MGGKEKGGNKGHTNLYGGTKSKYSKEQPLELYRMLNAPLTEGMDTPLKSNGTGKVTRQQKVYGGMPKRQQETIADNQSTSSQTRVGDFIRIVSSHGVQNTNMMEQSSNENTHNTRAQVEQPKLEKRTVQVRPAKLAPTNLFDPLRTVVRDKFCDDEFAPIAVSHDRTENKALYKHRIDSTTCKNKPNAAIDFN